MGYRWCFHFCLEPLYVAETHQVTAPTSLRLEVQALPSGHKALHHLPWIPLSCFPRPCLCPHRCIGPQGFGPIPRALCSSLCVSSASAHFCMRPPWRPSLAALSTLCRPYLLQVLAQMYLFSKCLSPTKGTHEGNLKEVCGK